MQEIENNLAKEIERIFSFLEGRVTSSLEDTVERVALFKPEMTFTELWQHISESFTKLVTGDIYSTLEAISQKKVAEKTTAELLIGKYNGELEELLQEDMFGNVTQKLSAADRVVILKLIAERMQANPKYKTDLEELFNTKKRNK